MNILQQEEISQRLPSRISLTPLLFPNGIPTEECPPIHSFRGVNASAGIPLWPPAFQREPVVGCVSTGLVPTFVLSVIHLEVKHWLPSCSFSLEHLNFDGRTITSTLLKDQMLLIVCRISLCILQSTHGSWGVVSSS